MDTSQNVHGSSILFSLIFIIVIIVDKQQTLTQTVVNYSTPLIIWIPLLLWMY